MWRLQISRVCWPVSGFSSRASRAAITFFKHPTIPELLNLQDVGGQAKPYQIRQFLRLVERYDLHLEEKAFLQ